MREKIEKNRLVIIAYSSLAVAVLSAFTTIVEYTNSRGAHRAFSLLDFLTDAQGFGAFVFTEYRGKVYVQYEPWQLYVLIVLGALAIACALVGLMRLSKQTDNQISFVLTVIGLIGTMIPAVVIFICIVALKENYLGTIACGIYPIVSPIAMIACIAVVTKMRKRNIEYRKKLKEAEGLIFRGGDL